MRRGTSKMVFKFKDLDVIRDVRRESRISDRSMAGQIEHWMKIGRTQNRHFLFSGVGREA